MYARSLSKRERERLIGVITIGPCGAVDTQDTVLATQDGRGTMLGELIGRLQAESPDGSGSLRSRRGRRMVSLPLTGSRLSRWDSASTALILGRRSIP